MAWLLVCTFFCCDVLSQLIHSSQFVTVYLQPQICALGVCKDKHTYTLFTHNLLYYMTLQTFSHSAIIM